MPEYVVTVEVTVRASDSESAMAKVEQAAERVWGSDNVAVVEVSGDDDDDDALD